MPWLEHSELSDPAVHPNRSADGDTDEENTGIVPMLRTLTRRPSLEGGAEEARQPWLPDGDFDQWLGLALQDAQSGMEGYTGGFYGEFDLPQEMMR
jgi:hypothetical protein